MKRQSRARWKEKWDRPSFKEELKSYVGQKGVFFHMSDLGPNRKGPLGDRLGINPRSSYDTPIGVYGYPLNSYFYKDILSEGLPFRTMAPWIHVFKVNMSNILVMSKYSVSAYQKDLAKLRSLMGGSQWVITSPYNPEYYYSGPGSPQYIWGPKPIIFKSKAEAEEMLSSIGALRAEVKDYSVDSMIYEGETTAYVKTPAGFIWNVTRLLAQRAPGKTSVAWSSIFRKLGYHGAFDDNDQGIIHRNEPTQLVVFSGSYLKRLNIIPNPALYKTPKDVPKVDSRYFRGFRPYGDSYVKSVFLPQLGVVKYTIEEGIGEGEWNLRVDVTHKNTRSYLTKEKKFSGLGPYFNSPWPEEMAQHAYHHYKQHVNKPFFQVPPLEKWEQDRRGSRIALSLEDPEFGRVAIVDFDGQLYLNMPMILEQAGSKTRRSTPEEAYQDFLAIRKQFVSDMPKRW